MLTYKTAKKNTGIYMVMHMHAHGGGWQSHKRSSVSKSIAKNERLHPLTTVGQLGHFLGEKASERCPEDVHLCKNGMGVKGDKLRGLIN